MMLRIPITFEVQNPDIDEADDPSQVAEAFMAEVDRLDFEVEDREDGDHQVWTVVGVDPNYDAIEDITDEGL